MAFYMMLRTMQNLICPAPEQINFQVIYEQRERVFHRVIQTRENNGEYTSAKRECFCPLFSSCSYGFSNESRRNKMFWFADLNRISNQAYRNYRIRFVVDDKH